MKRVRYIFISSAEGTGVIIYLSLERKEEVVVAKVHICSHMHIAARDAQIHIQRCK